MTELISGVPSLHALPDTAAELAQDIPTILSCHLLPTRPGRDETTPRGHPNYPPCWGCCTSTALTLLSEPSGGRCSGARGDLGGLKHRSLLLCQLCQMDILEATNIPFAAGSGGDP
jgi:hypothetical protein